MSAGISTPQEQRSSGESNIASQLVSVWALVSYTDEQPNKEDAQPFGPEPRGLLIYTPDGFVSAQLMKPGRSAFHSSNCHHAAVQEYEASGSGYIAYCGRYEVDEQKSTVTHIPSVALVPNLIDGRPCRTVEFKGNRLVLRTGGAPVEGGVFVTSRLEWKRVA